MCAHTRARTTHRAHTREGVSFHTGAFRPQRGSSRSESRHGWAGTKRVRQRTSAAPVPLPEREPVTAHTGAGGTGRTMEGHGFADHTLGGARHPCAHGPCSAAQAEGQGTESTGGIQKHDLLLPKPSPPTQTLVPHAKVTVPEDYRQLEPPPFRAKRKGKKRQTPCSDGPTRQRHSPQAEATEGPATGRAWLHVLWGFKGQAGWEGWFGNHGVLLHLG